VAAPTLAQDIRKALRLHRVWTFLARRSISKPYDRTKLGWIWAPLNVLLHTLIIGFVWGSVIGSGDALDHLVYFSLSYPIWAVIGRTIGDAMNVWPQNSKYINHMPMPLSMFPMVSMLKAVLLALMFIPMGFVVSLICGLRPNPVALLAIPGAILLLLNLGWVILFLSMVGARFRDVAKFTPNILLIIYLTTPIIWGYHNLSPRRKWIAEINPVYHLVELVRTPLYRDAPPATNTLLITSIMMVVGWAVALWLFSVYRKRIVLWL